MHSERVTFLTTPEAKAAIALRAAAEGISLGEFIRRKVEADNDAVDEVEMQELELLLLEVHKAIPEMQASLERSIDRMNSNRKQIDKMLRDAGIRK